MYQKAIIFVSLIALFHFSLALFDDEEMTALKTMQEKFPDSWQDDIYMSKAKAVLDGIMSRMNWKTENYQSQLKPYVQSLQQKEKNLQQAMQNHSQQELVQQLYQDLVNEQQQNSQTINNLGQKIQTMASQRAWIDELQSHAQGVESCKLRHQLLKCRHENAGLAVSAADIQEERRAINAQIQNLEGTSTEQEEVEELDSALSSDDVITKQAEFCKKRASIFFGELEKTIGFQEIMQQQQQRANSPQQVTNSASRFGRR